MDGFFDNVTGLSLGLGLPLLLLLSLLGLFYLCRWCPQPLRSLIRHCFGRQQDMYCPHCRQSTLFDDPQDQNQSRIPEGIRQYRQQYIKNHNDKSINQPTTSDTENELLSSSESFFSRSLSIFEFGISTTSFASPLATGLFPMENMSHIVPTHLSGQHYRSILVRAYSRQIQPI